MNVLARWRSNVVFYLRRWAGVIFRIHDHDPGGCPVIGCHPCGGRRS